MGSPNRAAYQAAIRQIDTLIRMGRGSEALPIFHTMLSKLPPRDLVASVARLAWRIGDPISGIRLLGPYVRPKARTRVSATQQEKAEYAACLIRFGIRNEALFILAEVDRNKVPSVLLYTAFALISRWDYRQAIPLLTHYLKLPHIDPYNRFVAKTNLAAALVYEREFPKADFLLRDITYELSLRRHNLLLGFIWELSAVHLIYQSKFSEAERFLDRAAHLLKETTTLGEFFVRKWKTILAIMRDGTGENFEALNQIRTEAVKLGHWETLRDCDRFEAIRKKDRNLFLRLYFGTPFESFRERLIRDFGNVAKIPETYDWRLGRMRRKTPILDLSDSSLDTQGLKSGQRLHRLLISLSRDFYRPRTVV